jgi:tagatose 1,6-diphosphate aldolase
VTFFDPGELRDDELELVLVDTVPADPARGWVPHYRFMMRRRGAFVGGIRFRCETNEDIERYTGHVGYNVDEDARGNHYAERAVRLLGPLMNRHGLDHVLLTCNPDNAASRRTCERLGAELVEIVELPSDNDQRVIDGDTHKCRYRLAL